MDYEILSKYNTLLDSAIGDTILKGFMVPNGYQLVIEKDDGAKVLNPGDFSGSSHSYQEVAEGKVEGWQLVPLQETQEAPFGNNSPQEEEENSTPKELTDAMDSMASDNVKESGMPADEFFAALLNPKTFTPELLNDDMNKKIKTSHMRTMIGKLEDLDMFPYETIDLIEETAKEYESLPEHKKELRRLGEIAAEEGKNTSPREIPAELKVDTPEELSIKDRATVAYKIRELLKPENATLENLKALYGEIENKFTLSMLTKESVYEEILEHVQEQKGVPFSKAVSNAVQELYPDSLYQNDYTHYDTVSMSDEVMSPDTIEDELSVLPFSIEDIDTSREYTKGELSRILGPQIVTDFQLFAPEQEYIPNPPKITDPLDISQIPKYKIRGKSKLESIMTHIRDVSTRESLNLPTEINADDEIDYNFIADTADDYEIKDRSIDCTRYTFDMLAKMVDSKDSSSSAKMKELVYAWSTGEYGASSAIGFAMRWVQAEESGRNFEDEHGYKEFILPNPEFSAKIKEEKERVRGTYRNMREETAKLVDAVFPEGLDVYRGIKISSPESAEEFLENNCIQLSSVSCFSSARNCAENFAYPTIDDSQTGVSGIKSFLLHSSAKGRDVAMLPSIATPPAYHYSLPDGSSIKPPNGKFETNRFVAEREATIISGSLFPFTELPTPPQYIDDGFAQYEFIEMDVSL